VVDPLSLSDRARHGHGLDRRLFAHSLYYAITHEEGSMARSGFAGRATLVVVAAVAAVAATAVPSAVAQGQASLPRHVHRAEGAGRQWACLVRRSTVGARAYAGC